MKSALAAVADNIDRHVRRYRLLDPRRPDRPREVIEAMGDLKRFQKAIYRRVLLPRLSPSIYNHGSIPGRSTKTNAALHRDSTYVLKADIANFFPSIHYTKVYELFAGPLKWSPDVARTCTRLCTYQHHLALGLVTSPILADQILRRVDSRLAGMCEGRGLCFTRFVDDLSISARYPLEEHQTDLESRIFDVLSQDGFRPKLGKRDCGLLSDIAITGIVVRKGRLDVVRDYVEALLDDLRRLQGLGNGDEFSGRYLTCDQMRGRICYVCWVNPRHKRKLIPELKKSDWRRIASEAMRRGLVAETVRLEPIRECASVRK